MVRLEVFPLFRKMIQIPGLVVILNEHNTSYRQIFTDGRPLPVDPNRSWNGYSSRKWEGDTFVVQTIGFRDGLWLDTGGSPLTDAAKVTEKFRRLNYGTLEIELTVDDSKAYTKPWSIKGYPDHCVRYGTHGLYLPRKRKGREAPAHTDSVRMNFTSCAGHRFCVRR